MQKTSATTHVNSIALQPQRQSSDWPSHLRELHKQLLGDTQSASCAEMTIELLHKIGVDPSACKTLVAKGVIQEIFTQLKQDNVRFHGAMLIHRRSDWWARIFPALVSHDIPAARQFIQRCELSILNKIRESPAYLEMQNSDGPNEAELYVARVAETIAAPHARPVGLEVLVNCCPEWAREEVLAFLGSHPALQEACDPPTGLGLEKAIGELKKQNTRPLAKDIGTAILEKVQNPGSADNLGPLFAKVDKGLRNKTIDLRTLIAGLCVSTTPKQLQQLQAMTVGRLLGHLIQEAREQRKSFDFHGFLQIVLHSGIPASCMAWITNRAILAIETTEELRRLVHATVEAIAHHGEMEGAQWHVLHAWADSIYQSLDLITLEATKDFFNDLRNALQKVIDTSEARSEVFDALAAEASTRGLKLAYAEAMSRKLQRGELNARQVADEWALGLNPAEFLGVLAAQLLLDRAPELLDALLIVVFESEMSKEDEQSLARALVDGWYAGQRRQGCSVITSTKSLCQILLAFNEPRFNEHALERWREHCFGFIYPFLSPYDDTLEGSRLRRRIGILKNRRVASEFGKRLGTALNKLDKAECKRIIKEMEMQKIKALDFSNQNISLEGMNLLADVLLGEEDFVRFRLSELNFSGAILGTVSALLSLFTTTMHKDVRIRFINFSHTRILPPNVGIPLPLQTKHFELISDLIHLDEHLISLSMNAQPNLSASTRYLGLEIQPPPPMVRLMKEIASRPGVETSFQDCNLTANDLELIRKAEAWLFETEEVNEWERGRAKCKILASEYYAKSVSTHFSFGGIQTLAPMMVLRFPIWKHRQRERALEILTERLKEFRASYTWKDLPGIKKIDILDADNFVVPTLQICYEPKFAEFLAHSLGFPMGKYDMRKELSGCNSVFLEDADRVRDELSELWQSQTKIPLKKRAPPPGGSVFNSSANRAIYAERIGALMQHNFIIGELHDQSAARNFILQNMPQLKKKGFTTCYLEHLPQELQLQVNAYLAAAPGTPMELELETYSYAVGCKDIIVAAKDHGIRVVVADSSFARRDGKDSCAPFNYLLLSLIETDAKNRRGGKFFALLGAAHVETAKGSVGVARMIKDCKSVFMHELNDYDREAKEFLMLSSDRREELAKDHPCADLYLRWRFDLYIGARNPSQMSLDRDNSERVYIPRDASAHKTALFET